MGAYSQKSKVLGRAICAAILSMGLSSVALADSKDSQKYDAEAIADIFYKLNGDPKDPHKKINHTKGFCAVGKFIPQKGIDSKLKIPLLAESSIPTQVRYSLGGGNPHASDKSKLRGMALKMEGKKDSWELVMFNAEINFAKNPQEFWQYFAIRVPGKDGKPDNEKIKKLTNEVDSYRNFDAYMNTIGITPSLANTNFNSVHAFWFKDTTKASKQVERAARWKFVPKNGVKYASQEEIAKLGDDFLKADFERQVKTAPIAYDMYLVFANKGDVTDNTTALWKGKHEELLVGTLEVEKYEGEGCNGDVFMPSTLPEGINPPKDPLFEIRNEVYGLTFGRRQ